MRIVLLLVAFVGFTAALFSWGYIAERAEDGESKVQHYYSLYNLFVLSMLSVPVLANVALMWIAVELTTLLSAFLVGFEDTAEALEAAWKYVVLTTLGAVLALLGFLILYWGSRVAGYEPFTWLGLGRSGAAHAARVVVAGLSSHPRGLRDQGRARPDAHLVARCAQPGAGLDLRAPLRRRDHDGALRHPAALSRDRSRARARRAALVHRIWSGLGRHRDACS